METDDFENLEVEDVVGDFEKTEGKKKKKNSKGKGNRVENELCKLLTKHFGKVFSRALGSGSRWGQVAYMPSHAKATLAGDVCPPEGFLWVVECKGGYDDTDIVCTSNAQFDEFIKQTLRDHDLSNRNPIICWKRSRKNWLAVVRKTDLGTYRQKFEYVVEYKDWTVVDLALFLENTPASYWFSEEKHA